jgi:hypothetical protein
MQRRSPPFIALRGLIVPVALAALVVGSAWGADSRDAALPRLSVKNVAGPEGEAGTSSRLVFQVRLTGAVADPVTVRYETRNRGARAGDDFVGRTGTLRFGPSTRRRTIVITIRGDTREERDERFALRLLDPVNATISTRVALGTIVDDDRSVLVAAAGDIACDPESGSFNDGRGTADKCRQRSTSDLLLGTRYAAVLPLGDNQYDDGTLDAYRRSYDLSWGRVKAISRPAVGNHEYGTEGAAGYFDYFAAAAGDRTKGYYSYDLGRWHLIALNSNCSDVGGCAAGSPQHGWLVQDLAAHPAPCTLAYWHHPRFSSGTEHGSDEDYQAFWQALYDAGADVVLAGHEHNYERFAPQTPDGRPDPARGLRQFVVGTGGKSHYEFSSPIAQSEVRDASSFGVLELRLEPSGYRWQFRAAVGSLADAGSGSCH